MKSKNMMIAVNQDQPLGEVVKELERLGYSKVVWTTHETVDQIITYRNHRWFSNYKEWQDDEDCELVSLEELKKMENVDDN